MGSLIINGTTYYSIAEAFVPSPGASTTIDVGDYYLLSPWGHPPRLGSEEREIMHVSFPGVNGVWRKNMGMRGRPIFIQMGTFGEDKPDAWSRLSDLMDHFNTFERFTIELPDGVSLDGCAQVPGGGETFDEFAVASGEGDTRVLILSSFQFRQYSYDNA